MKHAYTSDADMRQFYTLFAREGKGTTLSNSNIISNKAIELQSRLTDELLN
jgi:hypothetical protein